MDDLFLYIIFFVFFFLLEVLYFRIASENNIVDKPNKRSSHTRLTIRGGGIIFPISIICWFFLTHFEYPFFVSGLLLISLISFIDDLKELNSLTRAFFHLVAVIMMIYQLSAGLPWHWYALIIIIIIGFINAYNFMDGINGITGAYSITILVTFFYINRFIHPFISESFLVFGFLGLLVFNLFNFRKTAKCFAGDVGSISIAFIISFLLYKLILYSGSFWFIGVTLIYGLDTITTIIFRLIRRENIFRAHRTHFYQFLSNELQWPHLFVSGIYSFCQVLLNIVILIIYEDKSLRSSFSVLIVMFISAGILFLILRFRLEGSSRLFRGYRLTD